ncbi:MAG: AAA family ATPase [Anaerolineae bacterium]|nr:AAA family ATPase [Anaerolineae bacterium]
MTVLAFRVQNFMGFVDSGWIDLPSICLLFGRNSTGKSALIKALRMLQQSLESDPSREPLALSYEHGTDLGSYWDLVHGHRPYLDIELSFRCYIDPKRLEEFKPPTERFAARLLGEPVISENESRANLHLTFGLAEPMTRRLILRAIAISLPWESEAGEEDRRVFYAEWQDEERGWWFDPDFLKDVDPIWEVVQNFHARKGFLPWLADVAQETPGQHKEFYVIRTLLLDFQEAITNFLSSIVYLGPTRSEPQRFYYVPAASVQSPGSRGASSVQTFLALLDQAEGDSIRDRVNKHLADLRLGLSLHPQRLLSGRGAHEPMFEVQLEETGQSDTRINVCDVGFGLSQVIPIVFESVFTELESVTVVEQPIIIIEQPELHLHPSAQAELGDLFITTAHSGVRFLIETHSEHVLLRVRRRVAETSAAKAGGKTTGDPEISADQVALYFIDRLFGESVTYPIQLDSKGDFARVPAGFRDFFADDVRDVVLLSKASRVVAAGEA